MPRFAAFLRGINVGGRRVTGDRLRAPVVAMGASNVASFLASGNVVFDLGGRDGERDGTLPEGGRLERLMEERFAQALGFEVPTFVRSAEEIDTITAYRPVSEEPLARSHGSTQIALLRFAPTPEDASRVLALAMEGDALALEGRELYRLPSAGISQRALDLDRMGQILGEFALRTSNTVRWIHARFFGS